MLRGERGAGGGQEIEVEQVRVPRELGTTREGMGGVRRRCGTGVRSRYGNE